VDQAQKLREQVEIRRPPLRVVAVTSGKGGVGKTVIAANLAVLAARSGRRVLLLDADLGLANADIVLGITPTHHVGHLLDGTASLDDVLSEGPCGVRVLGAASGIRNLTALGDADKAALLCMLEPLGHRFDLVLIDCGAGIGENVLFFAGAAQEALLVISPEPTSLSDAYATVKVLSEHVGLTHFDVIANHVADFQGRDVFRRLTQVTDRFLSAHVRYLGHVPRDEELLRAVRARRPVVEVSPRAPAARALATLLDSLFATERPAALDGGMKLLWRHLLQERAPRG